MSNGYNTKQKIHCYLFHIFLDLMHISCHVPHTLWIFHCHTAWRLDGLAWPCLCWQWREDQTPTDIQGELVVHRETQRRKQEVQFKPWHFADLTNEEFAASHTGFLYKPPTQSVLSKINQNLGHHNKSVNGIVPKSLDWEREELLTILRTKARVVCCCVKLII